MRVLHLAPPADRPDRLTAHSFIDEEIVALRAAGVRCVTLSPAAPATLAERAGATAFAMRHAARLPAPALRSARETLHAARIEHAAAQLIRDDAIDLVHSHFGWPAGFGGALAAADAGVPLVASLRGMDLLTAPEIGYGLRLDPAYDAAIAQLVRAADRTLYATEYMRARGITTGAPASRTIVVRKGVDLQRFRPPADRAAAQAAIGVSGPMILAVGTLSPRKNLRLVLDALAPLRDRPWTFVIVGEGAERDRLAAHASAAGIGDRVRFAGPIGRADIGRYFAAADLFVHAAVMEAAGNVILEALAAGCPIVCTDAGGPTEYVSDGATGFVVAPGDADAMTQRIRQLLASPALRCAMANAARASAERDFAYARMIGDLVDIYADLVMSPLRSLHAGVIGGR